MLFVFITCCLWMTSKNWQPRVSINCFTASTSTTSAAINSWIPWCFFQCCLLQNMGTHSRPEDGICVDFLDLSVCAEQGRGTRLEICQAFPNVLSVLYSVKSSKLWQHFLVHHSIHMIRVMFSYGPIAVDYFRFTRTPADVKKSVG